MSIRPSKFLTEYPNAENGFQVYKDAWTFNFDRMDREQIKSRIMVDPRPQWCFDHIADLDKKKIVELGPSDGYNTAGLELRGAKNVTAIEGNSDCFTRCLILKNYLGLKAQYLYGDFVKFFEDSETRCDLCYASGVLYHVKDPLAFLQNVSLKSKHLFLWTHYYDADAAALIENERDGFSNGVSEKVTVGKASATYHRRAYNPQHIASEIYSGGMYEWANWISRDDLFAALEAYGFRIDFTIEDINPGILMPAVNIVATKI